LQPSKVFHLLLIHEDAFAARALPLTSLEQLTALHPTHSFRRKETEEKREGMKKRDRKERGKTTPLTQSQFLVTALICGMDGAAVRCGAANNGAALQHHYWLLLINCHFR